MTNEITKVIYENSCEIFYGGIYIGCTNICLGQADISVSVAEPGKPEMKRKNMQAGNSMDISYKGRNYRLILKQINKPYRTDAAETIVVSVLES